MRLSAGEERRLGGVVMGAGLPGRTATDGLTGVVVIRGHLQGLCAPIEWPLRWRGIPACRETGEHRYATSRIESSARRPIGPMPAQVDRIDRMGRELRDDRMNTRRETRRVGETPVGGAWRAAGTGSYSLLRSDRCH